MNFDIVWEDCIQEESRVANIEDDQALAIHTKGRKQSKFKKCSHTFKEEVSKEKKDDSKYQWYNYHKIGHLARECPSPKKKNNKRHHAHVDEDEDEEEERPRKRLTKEEDVEEYVLFYALSGSVTPGEDTWLIDSGASKHMIGVYLKVSLERIWGKKWTSKGPKCTIKINQLHSSRWHHPPWLRWHCMS